MKPRLAIHDTTIHVETFTSPWIIKVYHILCELVRGKIKLLEKYTSVPYRIDMPYRIIVL